MLSSHKAALALVLALLAGVSPAFAADQCFIVDAAKMQQCALKSATCLTNLALDTSCAAKPVYDAAACAANSVPFTPGTACGTEKKESEACGTEMLKSARCGATKYTKDAEHCGREVLSAVEKAAKCTWCSICKIDPKCDCKCDGPALSCSVNKTCELPKTCSLPKSCCQLKPANCSASARCDMSACEQQAKTLVTSLETLKNPFGQDGKLTSAAVCLLNNAIQESRGKMLKKVLKDKKVAEARRVLEEQVLDVSRDRFKAASKAALAAHEQLVKSQISALQSLTRDPVKSAKLWAVLIKVAHKQIDAELLALVKELEPYLNPFSKPKSAFSSALVREAPARPAGIVVTPEVTTKPAESALPGPWPRAWGLSLAGNLGVGLGGGFSIGFAVDPGFSVIVGVEELSFGGPIFEADMGLMANLYAQPPLDLDGPQVAISGGGAYMVGVGAGLSWSFCIPDLQPALASVIPHTSKTCDGPQIIQPQFGPLAVIPEPTLTFGPIVGIGASLQGTVGYSFELGAAGAVPPNY